VLLDEGRLWQPSGSFLLGYDAATGRQTHSVPDLYRREDAETYMPLILAGKILYTADTARNGHNKFAVWKNGSLPKEDRIALIPGVMSSVAPGRHPLVLGRNAMGGVTSTPVAEGPRLYVRSHRELFCLERNDAGKAYEADQVIRSLLAQIPPAPPAADGGPVAITPVKALPYDYRPQELEPGYLLVGWNILAPLTADEAVLAKETGFPAQPNFVAKRGKISVAGSELELRSMVIKGLYRYPSEIMTDPMTIGPAYDLNRIHQQKTGSLGLWAGIVRLQRPMVLRVDLGGTDRARLWLGGVEVRHGQRVRMERGDYALALRTTLAEARETAFQPRLWPAITPERETAHRQALIGAARPWLERLLPAASPPQAQAARSLLGQE
jgi:hypothetical protein